MTGDRTRHFKNHAEAEAFNAVLQGHAILSTLTADNGVRYEIPTEKAYHRFLDAQKAFASRGKAMRGNPPGKLIAARTGRFGEEAAEVRREARGYRVTRKGGSGFFGTVAPVDKVFPSEKAAVKHMEALPWSSDKMQARQRSRDAIRPSQFKPVFFDDQTYSVQKQEERGNLDIYLTRTSDGKEVASWHDDDARQMFEDGFFKPGPRLGDSVVEYAKSVGMIVKRGVKGNPPRGTVEWVVTLDDKWGGQSLFVFAATEAQAIAKARQMMAEDQPGHRYGRGLRLHQERRHGEEDEGQPGSPRFRQDSV